jgi:hypothetical protein
MYNVRFVVTHSIIPPIIYKVNYTIWHILYVWNEFDEKQRERSLPFKQPDIALQVSVEQLHLLLHDLP